MICLFSCAGSIRYYIGAQVARVVHTAGRYITWITANQQIDRISSKTMLIWLVQSTLWESTRCLGNYFQRESIAFINRVQVVTRLFSTFGWLRDCMYSYLPAVPFLNNRIGGFFCSAESIRQPFKEAIPLMRDRVEQLESGLKDVHEFIRHHPRLHAKISAIIREEPWAINVCPTPSAIKDVLNDPISEWRRLHTLLISLEGRIEERKTFLERFPEIAGDIRDCLEREKSWRNMKSEHLSMGRKSEL